MNYIEKFNNLKIFQRFPNFIPFVDENYADAQPKTLLIWESYYDTTNEQKNTMNEEEIMKLGILMRKN
jgi:hypothetical protein